MGRIDVPDVPNDEDPASLRDDPAWFDNGGTGGAVNPQKIDVGAFDCDARVRAWHKVDHIPARLVEALAAAPLVPEWAIREMQSPTAALSEREEQVLFALADGLEDKEIGVDLGIRLDTVKSHVRHVLAKLGARNRTHAVALAYHRGILRPLVR